MNTNLHLTFPGNCNEAFSFYETVFGTKRPFTMTYDQAPPDSQMPGADGLVMHTSLPVGSMTLMGCDAHPRFGTPAPINGVRISVDSPDEAEVTRVFHVLADGGKVDMPLAKTFWSPLFGMCTDKFGVEWMVSMPGPEMGEGGATAD